MAAFLHFNCFTLIAFLYLIVTSELPPGADCSTSESTTAIPLNNTDATTFKNKTANAFSNFREPLSLASTSKHGSSPFLPSAISMLSSPSSTSSFHQSSTNTSSSGFLENLLLNTSSRNAGRKLTRNNSSSSRNATHNDSLIILTNNNKTLSLYSPSTYLSATPVYLGKQDDDENGISASQSTQPSSKTNAVIKDDYEQLEETATELATKRSSSSSNKNQLVVVPPGKSSQSLPLQVVRRKKVAKTAAIDPYPVAYLMNSHYELESLPISKRTLDTDLDSGGGRNEKEMTPRRETTRIDANTNSNGVSSKSSGDNDDNSPNIEDLAMPLQNSDVDEGSNINSEISPDFTTFSQVTVAETTIIPLSSQDLESISSSDVTTDPNETTDEEKSTVNNQTAAGTTPLRGKCNDTLQCFGEHVDCRLGICKCQLGYLPRVDNGELCGLASAHHVEVPTTDPTMIGVVVGLALMSVTLCIVLRLFAKARFRENRTIFNTPNPRLMNVSLLKGSKTLLRGNSAGQRSRRGSQVSMNSGQAAEGQSPVNAAPDGNGMPTTAGSSHPHPHRVKPSRTLSTDTANLEGTPTSSRPSGNRSKFRQDSVASNV